MENNENSNQINLENFSPIIQKINSTITNLSLQNTKSDKHSVPIPNRELILEHPSPYNNEKIEKSNECGFTGNPETWFDENEYNKNLFFDFSLIEKKDSYFKSYSSFYIHEEMIKDKVIFFINYFQVRTEAYLKSIEKNKNIFRDKIVLDIGCGTGILSIFAAKAGAKHVYGVEFADIADYAKEVIKRNNLTEKITVIKAKVEEVVLPVDKVDIIISEWMGYFLLYESMLDTVLYARDKWLKPNGYILPDKAELYISFIEDDKYKSKKLNFWENIYGIKMDCFKPNVIKEPLIESCDPSSINSSICKVFEVDLYKAKKEDLDFSNSYEIEFNKKDKIHGLVAWFDIKFEKIPNQVYFSTSPYETRTHWKQTVFYTEKDFYVDEGSIAVRKSKQNFRALDVKISFHLRNQRNINEDLEDFVQLYKLK